jgi:SH3-like domain-containing protein
MRWATWFLLLTLCSPGTILAAPGDTLYVRGNHVNVRAAPSLKAMVLLQVHYGHVVIEIERRERWINVSLSHTKGRTGWIHASLLHAVSPAPPAQKP